MADTFVTVKSHRQEIEGKLLGDIQKSLEQIGLVVERQAKINVTKSPPSHPQVQTGRLRSSITHNVNPGEVEIGTNVSYGKWLELGSSHNPPYPFLFPAVEANRQNIINLLKG